jgi:hypothetical protein
MPVILLQSSQRTPAEEVVLASVARSFSGAQETSVRESTLDRKRHSLDRIRQVPAAKPKEFRRAARRISQIVATAIYKELGRARTPALRNYAVGGS